MMETPYGSSDGMGCLLGAVEHSPGMVSFVIVEYDQFATGFGSHRFDRVLLFGQGFELILLAENGTHGEGVVEGRASLLNTRVIFEVCLEPCFRIYDFRDADVFGAHSGDSGGEVEGVDSLSGRIGEQISDIGQALVVL